MQLSYRFFYSRVDGNKLSGALPSFASFQIAYIRAEDNYLSGSLVLDMFQDTNRKWNGMNVTGNCFSSVDLSPMQGGELAFNNAQRSGSDCRDFFARGAATIQNPIRSTLGGPTVDPTLSQPTPFSTQTASSSSSDSSPNFSRNPIFLSFTIVGAVALVVLVATALFVIPKRQSRKNVKKSSALHHVSGNYKLFYADRVEMEDGDEPARAGGGSVESFRENGIGAMAPNNGRVGGGLVIENMGTVDSGMGRVSFHQGSPAIGRPIANLEELDRKLDNNAMSPQKFTPTLRGYITDQESGSVISTPEPIDPFTPLPALKTFSFNVPYSELQPLPMHQPSPVHGFKGDSESGSTASSQEIASPPALISRHVRFPASMAQAQPQRQDLNTKSPQDPFVPATFSRTTEGSEIRFENMGNHSPFIFPPPPSVPPPQAKST
ncbi:hypothetical protein HDU97_004239 [Phlyctochytrium planicorne]|nr:hypothetical protein HDU97_004239 [Phlyctochytrium planicorne]